MKSTKPKASDDLLGAHELACKIYPQPRQFGGFVVLRSKDQPGRELPVPPPLLREGYGLHPNGTPDDERYLNGGKSDTTRIRRVLEEDDYVLPKDARILEFGCATARLLRWFEPEARAGAEAWGVDLTAQSIAWCQQHLSPPLLFATTTTAPHLPFEDGYFDLVFAGSVFTHIAELADAWFLELRRVLRPGGRLYVTIFDETSLEILRQRWPEAVANKLLTDYDKSTGVLSQDYAMFSFKSDPKATRVVYKRAALIDKLGRWFDFKRTLDQAYGWQTGYLVEKRPTRRP